MNNINIIEYFPRTTKIQSPRESQIEVLSQVDELIQQGKEKIIICAPTGSGKSGIAIALLNKYGGTYTSPLNVLVDQIQYDFEYNYTTTLKGRAHYPCVAKQHIGIGDISCDDGYCQVKKCSIPIEVQDIYGNKKLEYVERHCDDCDDINKCPCLKCEYKKQFRLYSDSRIGNTNFSMFQLGVTNKYDMIIIDECDDIENFIRLNNTVTIDEFINDSDFQNHIERIREIEIELEDSLNYGTMQDFEIKSIKRRISSIQKLLNDWDSNHKAWCVSHPKNNNTKYEPISIDRFFDKLIENRICILMSGTPKRLEGFEFIEVGSQFPKENRQWEYIPIGKMSSKHREESIPQIAQFISLLKGKTLVHCNSYNVAHDIGTELRILGIEPLLQVNYESMHPFEYSRKDIVSQFKRSYDKNQIMLSVNLNRGVDFPEEDIVNNVIAVVPWLNHNDKLVKAKTKMYGKQWQHVEMANTIMQAYGRLPRNADKYSKCYIVATDFNDEYGRGDTKLWYDRHKDLFFDWFKEAEYRK